MFRDWVPVQKRVDAYIRFRFEEMRKAYDWHKDYNAFASWYNDKRWEGSAEELDARTFDFPEEVVEEWLQTSYLPPSLRAQKGA